MKSIAIVLASGGMDSCVTAAIANETGYELAMLHANYGQRTQQRELEAYKAICDHFLVPESRRLIVTFDHLKIIGGSSLTDNAIPVSKADLAATTIPSSYVPFRNAHLLSMATSWAEVIGAERLFIGAVQEDSSGYPDCRAEFYEAFKEVIRLGTKPSTRLSIETPIIALSKEQIVRRGLTLNAPFHLTWSCYQNEDAACGVCDSCALRLRGFAKAGVTDPLCYAIRPDYST